MVNQLEFVNAWEKAKTNVKVTDGSEMDLAFKLVLIFKNLNNKLDV
jgi:hypothetical protein